MIDLTGQVAIITGAGGGLGREHALLLARRGAKIVVNDLGGSVAGVGSSKDAALNTVNEIIANGGEAIANYGSVTDFDAMQDMARQAIEKWGRIDILVNNAGFLRDKSFAKMELKDFTDIIDVHLLGAFNCTKAVWNHMREQNYGRIVMTTSSSGLYGNFGQANYGAAKMALVGLMQTLSIEGERNNIRVNCLAPTAGTRMLEGLMPQEILEKFEPSMVSPGVLALVSPNSPNRTILNAGAGSFETANISLTSGAYFGAGDEIADEIENNWNKLRDKTDEQIPISGFAQAQQEMKNAVNSGAK